MLSHVDTPLHSLLLTDDYNYKQHMYWIKLIQRSTNQKKKINSTIRHETKPMDFKKENSFPERLKLKLYRAVKPQDLYIPSLCIKCSSHDSYLSIFCSEDESSIFFISINIYIFAYDHVLYTKSMFSSWGFHLCIG